MPSLCPISRNWLTDSNLFLFKIVLLFISPKLIPLTRNFLKLKRLGWHSVIFCSIMDPHFSQLVQTIALEYRNKSSLSQTLVCCHLWWVGLAPSLASFWVQGFEKLETLHH